MKEIIFVTPQIKTGGGNRVFFELANVLANSYRIKIIYPNNSDEKHTFIVDERIQFETVGRLATSKIGKLINVICTFFYLNKYSSRSFVIISDPIMSIFGFLLRVKFKFRFIQADDYNIFNDGLIIRKGFLLKIYKLLTKFSYRLNFNFIFNSNYSYNQFCKYNPSFKKSAEIIHPAINHEIFNSIVRLNNSDKRQICLVARKHPLKGLQYFIDSWNGLPKEIQERVSKVVLISHDDLSEFDVKDFETVVPHSDFDIANVYQNSDIFISTSLSEGFGLPPLEAMACGSAVITSRSGGVDEFVRSGVNCLTYCPGDYQELGEKISELLNDSKILHKIQKRGVETVKSFDWRISAKKLAGVLERSNW